MVIYQQIVLLYIYYNFWVLLELIIITIELIILPLFTVFWNAFAMTCHHVVYHNVCV